jgi:hypothetical protein
MSGELIVCLVILGSVVIWVARRKPRHEPLRAQQQPQSSQDRSRWDWLPHAVIWFW